VTKAEDYVAEIYRKVAVRYVFMASGVFLDLQPGWPLGALPSCRHAPAQWNAGDLRPFLRMLLRMVGFVGQSKRCSGSCIA
jgi:hypothetical protein